MDAKATQVSNMAPTYLITAPGGHIGRKLVPLLLSQACRPNLVLMTSSPDGLQLPKASEGQIHVAEGNIQDPRFVENVLTQHGVTAVVLCLTGENELMVTLNLFDAMKHSGTVKHLVFVSANGHFGLDAIRAGAIRNNSSAHMLVKHILEAKLEYGSLPREQAGGFSWTIIGPTLFFDNDLRSKPSLMERGLFDEPLGNKGVSRVDTKDIALAIANTLKDDGKRWASKKIMVGSLERYTNRQVAALWSEALGTKISYTPSDTEGFEAIEKLFESRANVQWGRDVRLMYECFEAEGYGMTDAEYQDQIELLGKAPSRYEDFVERTANEWKLEKK
ncbi:hypothetical protein HJFPF1_10081 [Paramyrothecium foliicola]|nr:hypothetical protein HJFPF1_10081 [Paramyrothecium foliicola]